MVTAATHAAISSTRDGDDDSSIGDEDAASRAAAAQPSCSWVTFSVVCCPLLVLVWLLAAGAALILDVAHACVSGCMSAGDDGEVEGDAEMDWDWDEEEAFGTATWEPEEGHIEGNLGFVGDFQAAEEAAEDTDSDAASFQPSVTDSMYVWLYCVPRACPCSVPDLQLEV